MFYALTCWFKSLFTKSHRRALRKAVLHEVEKRLVDVADVAPHKARRLATDPSAALRWVANQGKFK